MEEGRNSYKSDPRDRKRYYFRNTLFRRVFTGVVRSIFLALADIHVHGVENLPDEGAVVLVANHLTTFDVFPMQFAIPRLIFYMGKAELFRNPLMDSALRRLGAFPVERGARDEWAIKHALKVLEHGEVLGIFPEGTRSRGNGLLPAKTGGARLAIEAHCSIVLMAIDGTQRMFRRFPRRTRVDITLGEPINPQEEVSPLVFTDQLMFTLAEMLPPELRGVYAVRPKGFRLNV